MVSVENTSDILLADCQKALIREAINDVHSDLERVFVGWALPVAKENAQELIQQAVKASGGVRTYQHIAILGYALGIDSTNESVQTYFQDGVQWLIQRPAFTAGGVMGFCTDEVALLGIVLGVRQIGDILLLKAVGEWLQGFIDQSYNMRFIEPWQKCFFALTKTLAGVIPVLDFPQESSISDIKVFFRGRGLLPPVVQSVSDEEINSALLLLKDDFGKPIGASRAAIRAAAFEYLIQATPTIHIERPSIEQVCNLLREVPNGLRRWTWEDRPRTSRKNAEPRKWHVDNEYHVQNLLYFILAAIFPDLKEEEYRPNIGQKHPRLDLAIPSLNLIIEVKFKRSSMSFADVIEEIAADCALYLSESGSYTKIIPFIWDESRRTEEHHLLIQGLKKLPGIVDAVVISRPGAMLDTVNVANADSDAQTDIIGTP